MKKPLETAAVISIRRAVARYVWGNRDANACCCTITGRIAGGSSW